MPLLDGLRVVKSRIHGYGVVTTRAFRAGELICFGDGVYYEDDADFDDTYALILPADRSESDPLHRGPSDDGTDRQVFWDLADQTRWFNHSCDPNTDVQSRREDATTMRAWWVATRDIPAGEEITYDYGFAAEVAEPCACGAARCRGVIVDDDPEVQAQLPDHLRRLLRGAATESPARAS